MKNCTACLQPLPRPAGYREAPERDAELEVETPASKRRWKFTISPWLKTTLGSVFGLLTGLLLIIFVLGCGWVLTSGVYYLGSFVNDHTIRTNLNTPQDPMSGNLGGWFIGFVTLASPFILWGIKLMGVSILKGLKIIKE